MGRPDGREPFMLRPVKITRNYLDFAEGAVLVEFGKTRVLCTATLEEGAPSFLSGTGWLTAEYAMLPKSCRQRVSRAPSGRTQEIQRIIGRALRAVTDLNIIGERTIRIDCDVLQADGGTRTAAVTGASVALHDALTVLMQAGVLAQSPLKGLVAGVSVGILRDQVVLDMDYREDSEAEIDMNVIMTEQGEFVEVQGTGESHSFSREQLNQMLDLATSGIQTLIGMQKKALGIGR